MAKKETCTKAFNLRVTQDLYDRISERARDDGESSSAWVKKALEFALDSLRPHTSEELSREALVNLLTYDEGISDLIYQKVCEKLKMNDILSEFAHLATHCRADSAADLSKELCTFAARMHYLISEPVDEDEIIQLEDEDCSVCCTLSWKSRWTLEEFYGLSADELKGYDFFFMECADSGNELRSEGMYFWQRSEDVSRLYPVSFFNSGELVYVHGAVLINDTPEQHLPRDVLSRVVNMVRYVSRDYNLGVHGVLTDVSLRSYYVRNKGYFPRGIPYEFVFGWVSDDLNLGEYNSEREFLHAVQNKADKTLRPVVSATWHYTESDLLFRDDLGAVPPFNECALPQHLGRGMYVEADEFDEEDMCDEGEGGEGAGGRAGCGSGGKRKRRSKEPDRLMKPVWVEADDPTRNEAAGRSEFVTEFNKGKAAKKEKKL
ncbi:MAG TPA: hypothetical protein O0X97_05970 [Methanocorpusculum sp.]|nr:hypothetical protein [Methanocorpusculum sp.]